MTMQQFNIQITADGTAELAGTTVTLDSSGGITLDADGGTITFSDGGVSEEQLLVVTLELLQLLLSYNYRQ